MELSAPRAEILRVRVGKGALPADESWAVSQDTRGKVTPLAVRHEGQSVEISTSALEAQIDLTTLALTVHERDGRTIFATPPGIRPLTFCGAGFQLRQVLAPDEHLFGLGDKTGPLDRRGGVYTLWNTDAFGYTPASDPLYKAIPFLLEIDGQGGASGLFIDNTWRTTFDLGKTAADTALVSADGGPVNFYVMAGRGPKAILQEYAFLTGVPPLPPLWALGFQQSHWGYRDQATVKAVAERLRTDRLPADALWLDIDYLDRKRPFTIDRRAFPDLPRLVSDLTTKGLHLVTIVDLHIADAPRQDYTAYDTGMAKDVFVHGSDDQPYVGEVWPGPSLFPDSSRASVRRWWGSQFTTLMNAGVAGIWNDMNEPSVFDGPGKTMPLDVIHKIDEPGFRPRNASHAEMHNVFGLLNTRATYEGLLALRPNQRPFVMTRASYAGGQRYAVTWTGDNTSSWAHLSLSIEQLVSLGLSGFAWAGDDIGGFTGDAPSPELLTRWIEVGAFNPIFRDHSDIQKPPQEPWVGDPEQETIRRHYIEARYRLMPYLYGLADEASRTGVPLLRPVFLEYPAVLGRGERLGGTDQQFMLGPALLVAPPRTWESRAAYSITLPGPGWYDYWTGLPLSEAKTLETPVLARLPVFVRPGSIIPRQPLVQSTSQVPDGPLELSVYPGPDCQGLLYLDDGQSFNYLHGAVLRQSIDCDPGGLDFSAREGSFKPWWKTIHVVVHGWRDGRKVVRFGGHEIPARVNTVEQTLSFELPDVSEAGRVTFQ